ncbi:MAG: RNA methyltransferase [Bdellovibrionaceae bacterium]|nr:RNA methyltransferase [Pseudobdellovibrionaceae bacterium]
MDAERRHLHRLLKRFARVSADSTMAELLTESRRQVIDKVLSQRTRSVVPVLDQIYDVGNISAVLRSAESFGFLECHIIAEMRRFRSSKRITQGAHQWMEIQRWNDTEACLQALSARGYALAATSFEDSVPIEDLPFDRPLVLIFGNEKDGVSPAALKLADYRFHIPMYGFTRSFNVSVAAALALYVVHERRQALGLGGDLSEAEIARLRRRYQARSSRLFRSYAGKLPPN